MKSNFDYTSYLKPMMSRIGVILSKENDFLKRALSRKRSPPFKIKKKVPSSVYTQKKNTSANESPVFRSRTNRSFEKSLPESPAPGQYYPEFNYLYKKGPTPFIPKAPRSHSVTPSTKGKLPPILSSSQNKSFSRVPKNRLSANQSADKPQITLHSKLKRLK